MSRWAKALDRARNNPAGLRFSELTGLAKRLGFRLDRQRCSHEIYLHENGSIPGLNLQQKMGGNAKPYQVRQLLDIVDAYKLTLPGEEV